MEQKTNAPAFIECQKASIHELRDAIKNRIPIRGIKAIITNIGATADEYFAMHLMMYSKEGQRLFPGAGGCLFYTEKQLEGWKNSKGFYLALKDQGAFILGTAGGPFDDHGKGETIASTSQLMADYLDVQKTKTGRYLYSPFMDYITKQLTRKITYEKTDVEEYAKFMRPGMFFENIRKGWRTIWAEPSEEVRLKKMDTLAALALAFISNELDAQKLFIAAKKEYYSKKPETIALPFLHTDGMKRSPVILIVRSDNPEMVSAAKNVFASNQEMEMRVILSLNSRGQFYICPMYGSQLGDTVKSLRMKLAMKRGVSVIKKLLDKDETLHGVEDIFYDKNADSIHNGSNTQPDAYGLIGNEFTEQDVIDSIFDGLSAQFHPQHHNACKSGTCLAHTGKIKCRLYKFAFSKCLNVQTRM